MQLLQDCSEDLVRGWEVGVETTMSMVCWTSPGGATRRTQSNAPGHLAITVYGSVIAGGIALTRVEIEQDPALKSDVKKEELDKRLPKLKY